jgi:hypothetical protein
MRAQVEAEREDQMFPVLYMLDAYVNAFVRGMSPNAPSPPR